MHPRSRLARLATALLLLPSILLAASSTARAAPCAADAGGDMVCGEGLYALRVIPETYSPDKTLAFAWRLQAGKPPYEKYPDPNDVENVLVRLADGKVLTMLGGKGWNLGDTRASLYESWARYSGDRKMVVEAASDKHQTYALNLVTLEGGKAATLDLLALVEPAARKKLPAKDRDEQAFRVRYQDFATFLPRDRIRFGVAFRIPGSGRDTRFDVTVRLGAEGGTPGTRVMDVRTSRPG